MNYHLLIYISGVIAAWSINKYWDYKYVKDNKPTWTKIIKRFLFSLLSWYAFIVFLGSGWKSFKPNWFTKDYDKPLWFSKIKISPPRWLILIPLLFFSSCGDSMFDDYRVYDKQDDWGDNTICNYKYAYKGKSIHFTDSCNLYRIGDTIKH